MILALLTSFSFPPTTFTFTSIPLGFSSTRITHSGVFLWI
jgi:hypothetical protein